MSYRRFLGVGAAAALGAVGALLALGMIPGALPAAAFTPKLELDGRVARAGEALAPWLEQQAARWGAGLVYLQGPEDVEAATWAELGVKLDVAATLQQVLAQSRQLSWFERLRQRYDVATPAEIVTPIFAIDSAQANTYLRGVAERLRREPQPAGLDLRRHIRTSAKSGRELDVPSTLANLAGGVGNELFLAPMVFKTLAPPLPLGGVDIASVLSAYTTDFRGKAGARAVNIARAAKLLNGTLLAPAAVFSFNNVVGPRTLARGFVDAPVIVNDELEAGVGGGVCQVATTLHAAAIYGALEILERRSHSRPSGYAPLGLDATVIDGELDLKLRNPYSKTLLIHAYLPTKTSIRIEFLGSDPPAEVVHESNVTKRSDFVRRVSMRPELVDAEPLRRQRGHYGYDVSSTVKIRFSDGRREARRFFSKYYPVPEVYWVKPGYDITQLPALPEGATGTDFSDVAPGSESRALPLLPSEQQYAHLQPAAH